jgi:aspartate-semialdehyde dehydrogenase
VKRRSATVPTSSTAGFFADVSRLIAPSTSHARPFAVTALAPLPDGRRWPVAVLGATGAVGQTFIRLLVDHPWFELADLAASERSAGQSYADAAKWLDGAMPAGVRQRTVVSCDPSEVSAPIVFSALDSSVAGEVEAAFARAGCLVFSNAKNYRMDPTVPLLIPEVNPDQLGLIDQQRRTHRWSGAILTNANCAATVAAIPLAPLHNAFGITQLFLTTMQAVSGAGYPGVASLDILGNAIPFIADEEPKIEAELGKLLGRTADGAVVDAGLRATAHANRVAVEHGHTVCASIGFRDRVSAEQAIEAIDRWDGDRHVAGLPSAGRALVRTDAPNRPQPRRDVMAGNGMTVTVGRVRIDPLLDVKLVAMGHNVVRGAAGGSILNAELALARGLRPHAA